MSAGGDEPIAIVGLACRFPGAEDSDAFWRLLRDGVDAIGEVPADRWDVDALYDPDLLTPGSMSSRWGGFMRGVGDLDAGFFGLSALEAAAMDPQQRLTLEASWTALEHAGVVPARLAGTRGGVFIGVAYNDYASRAFANPENYCSYSPSGTELSMVPNRISHFYDLRGPSLAVNTGCSSSLVAVHLACDSLRSGESEHAIAGGVSLILAPEPTIALSHAWMLAADGRCKAFDERADGYVRGEGCGVVVLKRLSDARRDGDRVLAVVRGSAVNHGGRGAGLTAPNGEAQRAVLRAALAAAATSAHEVSYVEAHGVGTRLGDATEIAALQAVLGGDGPPCAIGSVKTNIGHLEWASGVASLIKTVLALQHETIPKHLHLTKLSPDIQLDGTRFVVPSDPLPWPRQKGARVACVNSFGLGGTNAHVVLADDVSESQPEAPMAPRPLLLTLSARTPEALRRTASDHEARLVGDVDVVAMCATSNTRRTHFEERAALVADDVAGLRERLAAFAAGETSVDVERGRGGRPRVAFLFTGQGAQHPGMAAMLARQEPVFREALTRCAALFEPSILSMLLDADAASVAIHQTQNAQPALFAVEYALAELWRSWGLVPDALLGHSVGEYVAAFVGGALSLEDAATLVAERGRLMGSLPPGGAMVSVIEEEGFVRERIASLAGAVDVAAVNGPRHIVVSGVATAIDDLVCRLDDEGVATQRLTVSHAFHSALMDPILDAFEEAAARVSFARLRIPVASNLTGQRLEVGHVYTAKSWRAHLRGAVRFCDGVRALVASGIDTFVEVGPSDTLAKLGRRCVEGDGFRFLPSLHAKVGAGDTLAKALAALHCRGAELDWRAVEGPRARRIVSAPTYPFERRRYWFASAPSQGEASAPNRSSANEPELLKELRRLPSDARHAKLRSTLQDEVASLLGWSSERRPDADVGLFALGLTSLGAVALQARVQGALGGAVAVPPTTLFAHPTIDALTLFVLRALSLAEPALVAASARLPAADEPIAIVGIGLRTPGGARSSDELWALLREGVDATSEVPADRWPIDELYSADRDAPGRLYTRRGGFLGDVAGFDAEFFGLSAREAEAMDPQHRLLLEVACEALDDAGCRQADLRGSRTGVFAGIISNEYGSEVAHPSGPESVDAYHVVGNIGSAVAGRVSYHLGLNGPSLAVDTACSSSLVAVHLACQSLRAGECDRALAGGVNLILSPTGSLALCRAQALASDGRCKTFDADADGYGRGEGCGIVVLRPLSQALADRDRVLAILRGSAVNHDGRSAGFTVPSGAAQSEVVRAALRRAGVEPDDVDYVEAHGTGTPLGDPVEVGALADVFVGRSRALRLASVKTNLGHLEAAAGVIGLIKVALSLSHEALPPHLHLGRLNPDLPVSRIPIEIPRQLSAWPRGEHPRLAGVSAFGMSGTNAHVIVEEAASVVEPSRAPGRLLPFVLTARTEEGLRASAAAWSDWLATTPSALPDIAHTAAIRRTHHRHRVVVLASARAELRTALNAIRDGESNGRRDVFLGAIADEPPPAVSAAAPIDGDDAAALRAAATLAVAGVPVRWAALMPEGRVVSLPNYAWQRRRHWRTSAQPAPLRSADGAPLIAPSALLRGDDVAAELRGERVGAPVAPTDLPADVSSWLYEASWRERALVPGTSPSRVVLVGSNEVVDLVAADLETSGATVVRASAEQMPSVDGDAIVDLRAVEAPFPAGASPSDRWLKLAGDLLELAQRTAAAPGRRRLYIVTRMAVADAGAGAASSDAAPLWGMGRVIQHEHPELACTLIDFAEGEGGALAREVLADAYDTQVVLRGQRRLTPELKTLTPSAAPAFAEAARLETRRPGFVDDVRFRRAARRAPGPGEIEVRVTHLPLSFLDVMRATAMNDEPPQPASLGHEWAGEVVRIGAGVTRVGVGELAIGVTPDGVGTFVTVRAELAVVAPAGLELSRAATLPLAFSLAHHALIDVADLRPGERLLIHSATGAVGQACLQIARGLGAEVLATAGDEPRREWLRRAGVRAAFDSRTLSFVDGVRRETNRQGVDVVVSSVAGAAVAASRALLRPFGRFVDIGRRRLRGAARGGDAVPDNVSSVRVDLVRAMTEQPDRIARLLDVVARRVREGALTPLEPELRPATEAAGALRAMAQLRHLGKVVLTLEPSPPAEADDAVPRVELRKESTYLVTGGLGGLGLEVARWLVERGARRLVLVGRRPPSDSARESIAALVGLGAAVTPLQADLGSRDDVERMLTQIRSEPGTLAGIVHAAGVLDDAVLAHQSRARLEAVFAAKAAGAWHLHELVHEPLDFFVLFSSLAAAIGSPAQINYAAANAALDALAQLRRARKLPALSIQWGPWDEVGMAAVGGRAARAAALGLRPMAPRNALAALERLLRSSATQVLVVDAPWHRLSQSLPGLQRAWNLEPLLENETPKIVVAAPPRADAVARLRQAPPAERLAILAAWLRGALASVLHVEADVITPELPLDRLGVDSLAAVELNQRILASHGHSLPVTELLRGQSLGRLAGALLAKLGLASGDSPEQSERRTESAPPWFVVGTPRPAATHRLICFPYAGGGPSVFRDWSRGLPPTIEVVTVQLPGRAARIGEPPLRRMDLLVEALADGLEPCLDRPFAFFGHCMGALVMFEVTRQLRRRGKPMPHHLFASASPAPDGYLVPALDPATGRYIDARPGDERALVPVHALPPRDFFDVLRFLNFRQTRVLLDDEGLMRAVLPTVQADFEVCDRYLYRGEPPLAIPISAFGGDADPFATPVLLRRWNAETTSSFELTVRPGDHYFLVPDRDWLLETVARRFVAEAPTQSTR